MKNAVVITVGFLSSFLIYLITEALLYELAGLVLLAPVLKFSIFLECWVFSTILLVYRTSSITQVIERGFLLGAIEWLAVILSGLVFKIPLIPTLMMLFCLAGFATTRAWMREPVRQQ
jgi:cobalamin synthase